jgi:steroid 5-alpha reductase family enzyme
VAIAAWLAREGLVEVRVWVVLIAVIAWGGRLTFNWARGWQGLGHEDWRYVDIRQKTGRLYWAASFLAVHLFPSVLTFLGSLPLAAALTSSEPLGNLDLLATAITFGAIAIETAADEQLHAHRSSDAKHACDVGLWKYSRHPNYFGEILFWVGLWLFGLAAGAPVWTVIGPVAMLALFVFASIPMAEKRALSRRPDFAEKVARVSMLVPWPPKA